MHADESSNERPNDADHALLRAVDRLLPILPLSILIYVATYVGPITAGDTFTYSWQWVPSLDVKFSLYIDGLSLLFALLISGVGTVIFAYAPGYFGDHPDRGRLYGWLVIFMFAMLGLVLANDIITLFVFWELTSISSYMLIGFKHESERARAAALQALLVTGLGGLALLAGLVMLGHVGGSYELTSLLTQSEILQSQPLLVPIVALILLGAFTKSAQFPFHFWLPNAMEAPTPVSAYLHSATMVKAGVYLVARLTPVFSGTPVWHCAIVCVGTITALTGGWLAIQQTDLKRILAYSTVSALGTLMLLLGFGTGLAITAAITFLLCHSLYKATLFLVAGTIDHETGTRDIGKLGGLARAMPLVAATAALASLSMAGVPPAGGFIAKEFVYEAAIELPHWAWAVVGTVFLVNLSFVVVACLLAIRPFFGNRVRDTVASPKKTNPRITVPPLLLAILGIVVGFAPTMFAQDLVTPAILSIAHDAAPAPLKLWHGWNLALLLSTATLLAGLGIYATSDRLRDALVPFRRFAVVGPSAGYDWSLHALKSVAAWQTRVLQNGHLRVYLLVVLVAFSGLLGFELVDHIEMPSSSALLDVRPYELFIPALVLGGIMMTVVTSSRLAAVCALGVIGYAAAMLFVMFGAPDLAMTQLAIETLTVVLFVFVVHRLPRFASLSSRAARARDAVVALTAGGVMTAVVLAATFAHAPSRLTPFFAENSLTVAKGRNMVNVILVDFRALDTLAEITVLAIAALGIFALLRLRLGSAKVLPNEREMHASPEISGQFTTHGAAKESVESPTINDDARNDRS